MSGAAPDDDDAVSIDLSDPVETALMFAAAWTRWEEDMAEKDGEDFEGGAFDDRELNERYVALFREYCTPKKRVFKERLGS